MHDAHDLRIVGAQCVDDGLKGKLLSDWMTWVTHAVGIDQVAGPASELTSVGERGTDADPEPTGRTTLLKLLI